ncbi:MAG: hypothetical protein RBT43_02225 [bacterium]|jgi:hypothetical protein|nr:hypothetical protein [bacterium]
MKMRVPVLMLVISILFLSCGTKISDYYPLREGLELVYQIDKSDKQNVENFKARELNKVSVVPQKIEIAKGTAFRFIAVSKEGIYNYAYQAPGATEPEILAQPEYILKNPLKPGKGWEAEASIMLLLERLPYTMSYLVESKKETVTVPAGTFENCLLIKGSGLAQKDKGALGVIKISVSEDSWYAPGVGLVKSVRKESGNHVLVGSSEKIIQLLSYKK